MKSILFILFILAANIHYAQNTYKSIEGIVVDDKDSEVIPFADVKITSSEVSAFTQTDLDGKFRFDSLPEGDYSLKFSYEMSALFLFDTVRINHQSTSTFFLHVKMHVIENRLLTACTIITWNPPPPPNPTLSYKEIQKNVNKHQLPDLVRGMSSNALGNEGKLSLIGAREGDYLFLIDGVKCRELQQIPSSAMKSITVMSHFIPANYGDTTGGVISVETMSYMDLYYERERQKSGY